MRTPITTIFGLTQILGRPGRLTSAEDQAELIGDIAAEAERLLVSSRTCWCSRGRSEADRIESEPIELRRASAGSSSGRPQAPSIRIEADLPRGLPIVAGEDTYVEQIVREHARATRAKYTPPGTHGDVRAEQEGGTVIVRVVDSRSRHRGILRRARLRALLPRPDHGPLDRRVRIGLFVCASLVEAMGGRIWARRRPEGGSEFGFTLRVIPERRGRGLDAAARRTSA